MKINNIFIAIVASILSGCTAQYQLVGSFDHYNEVFRGDVNANLSNGTAQIVARGEQTGMTCRGGAHVTHVPAFSIGCNGQAGVGRLTCDDGRVVNVDYTVDTCTSGKGYGQDNKGNTFTFVFGLNKEEADAKLTSLRPTVANKPELPVYRPKETRKEKGFSTGTGFFVTSDGHMITNFHVIEDAKTVSISIDGDLTEARVLKTDPANDVALLKIPVKTQPIPLLSVTRMERADEVFTLGYPNIAILGQSQKATFGRINALSGIADDIRFYQVDVPIQPGNSGGPLVNHDGQVVGVMTMTLNSIVTLIKTGSIPQNVNYAVKSDYIVPLLRDVPSWSPATQKQNKSVRELVANYEKSVALVIAK